MTKYYIYTLTCPIDNIVKYVGCTNNYKARITHHSGVKYCRWRNGLRLAGLKPIGEIITECATIEEAIKEEKRVYEIYKSEKMVSADPEIYKYQDKKRSNYFTIKRSKELSPIVARNIKTLLSLNRVSLTAFHKKIQKYYAISKKDLKDMINGKKYFTKDVVFSTHLAFNTLESCLIRENQNLSHRFMKGGTGSLHEVNYWQMWSHKKWSIEKQKAQKRSSTTK